MTRLAWYKRYPADFREGTRKLTFEERGFYGDVLDLIYESGNALVDDDADNAHQLRADLRTYRRLKARLIDHGKLYVADGMLRNGRADAEATAAATRIALARDHAKLGGEKSRKSGAKSSNYNGSGGAGAQAGAEPAALTGVRSQKEVIESTGNKTESLTVPTPPADAGREARAVLWAEAKAFLGGTNPGGVIGKWCRDYGEGAFVEAYFIVHRERPADPTSRIAGILKARSKRAGGGVSLADKLRAQLAAEGVTLQ